MRGREREHVYMCVYVICFPEAMGGTKLGMRVKKQVWEKVALGTKVGHTDFSFSVEQ